MEISFHIGQLQYSIMYSDGDSEDLSWKEVRDLFKHGFLGFRHRVRMRGRLLPTKPLCLHCITVKKRILSFVKGPTLGAAPKGDGPNLRGVDYLNVRGYIRVCTIIFKFVHDSSGIDKSSPEWLQLFGPEGILVRTTGLQIDPVVDKGASKHQTCNIVTKHLPGLLAATRPNFMIRSVHKGEVVSTTNNGVIVKVSDHHGFLARRAGPLVQHFSAGDDVSVQIKRMRDALDTHICLDLKTPDRLTYNRCGNRVICCVDLEVLGTFHARTGYVMCECE